MPRTAAATFSRQTVEAVTTATTQAIEELGSVADDFQTTVFVTITPPCECPFGSGKRSGVRLPKPEESFTAEFTQILAELLAAACRQYAGKVATPDEQVHCTVLISPPQDSDLAMIRAETGPINQQDLLQFFSAEEATAA